ncbi:MAG: YgjV family protein [Firmicutes bacterium]|nr:YgjV family protein [Bacillota bacterium]
MIPEVITTGWIVSQVFTFFALISIICAYQIKKKKWTLVFVMAFNAMMAVGSALLGDWLLVGIYSIGFFRDGSFLLVERYAPKNRALSIFVVCAFMAGSVVVAVIVALIGNWWWFDIPLVAASMFVDFGSWKRGVHWIRISRVTWCSMVMVNHVRNQNIIAIGIEIFIIISVAVFYVKYFRKKRLEFSQSNAPAGLTE